MVTAFEKVFLKKASDTLRDYSVFFSGVVIVQFALVFFCVIQYKMRVRAAPRRRS